MTDTLDQLAYERCADCPENVFPEPVPVLGPFIGVVGSVLCGLSGALLLLAPFAFDYRQGAGTTPRSSVVDLVTGTGVLVVSLLTATLFGGALRKRLGVPEPAAAYAAELASAEDPAHAPEPATAPEPAPVESAPEPRPAAPAAATPLGADPGDALRDLLTPLVAALAADLRARESRTGTESEGR